VAPALTQISPLGFFLWEYVEDIVYKTSVTSLDELKLRILAGIETVARQFLENT
jgi:hypothetical protein